MNIRLSKIIDHVAYPTGTVLDFHFKKLFGKSPEKIIEEAPKRFYEALVQLNNGDETSTKEFLKLLARLLNRAFDLSLDPETFMLSFLNNDSEYFEEIFKKLKEKEFKEKDTYLILEYPLLVRNFRTHHHYLFDYSILISWSK